jgi:hypothetical protein
MIIGSKCKGEEERYLNLLLSKEIKVKKEETNMFLGVVVVGVGRGI